jgi:serine phosphatase RsbU (regulator of sigma subunit)
VPLRKSTKIWLAVLAAAIVADIVIHRVASESGCWGLVAALVIAQAACILLWRAGAAAFRVIVRRLTLRLAFSYFLIGIVPIPLLAAMLSLCAYIVAHQFIANRLRREITTIGDGAARSDARFPELVVGGDGRVTASPLPWFPAGSNAPWYGGLERPGFLVHGDEVWLAVRHGAGGPLRLLELTGSSGPWVQELADRTGYEVGVDAGTTNQDGPNFNVSTEPRESGLRVAEKKVSEGDEGRRKPAGAGASSGGLWHRNWVHAFYLETALNAEAEKTEPDRNVAVLMAVTSPHVVFTQLFTQGVTGISAVFRIAFLALAAVVVAVYAVALAVAFVLVGRITRNVNRLTRATRAVAAGDFSVRVASKSRDQIGDLARSFDGMAASIQGLLVETAEKQRLENEIAVARTIQQKLLPATEARLGDVSVLAHFAPVAEMGGDYYDYLTMPDGRLAFALGDVSGHGLPTGLLVAMAKSALSALVEAGHDDGDLFARLNDLIHRSTDPRHYMTLAFLAYDPRSREAVLTNAGQLAPYRCRGGRVEALPLPSFPLGLFPGRTFPSRPERFEPGDLFVFHSDGLIEAADGNDEPFGFERFEEILRSRAGAGPAAVRDALLAAVEAHTGSRAPEDDRTLLLLSFDGEATTRATAIESPPKSSE